LDGYQTKGERDEPMQRKKISREKVLAALNTVPVVPLLDFSCRVRAD